MNLNEFVESEKIKNELEHDLADLISIKSIAGSKDGIYPYGKECGAVLDKMLSLGEKYGFTTENHDYHCGSVIYGNSEKEIGIIAHLDVVPVGNGWSTDPFVLTKRKNCYIGRGTK
ncbi:MAG: dipeptidase, partial [Clostridia bacterium]